MESAKGEVCLSGEGAHKPLGGHRWWAAGKSPNNSWMFIAGKAQTKSDRFFFATTFDYLDMLLMNFHEIWNNLGNFFVFRSSFLGTENTNRDANLGSRHLSAFGVPLKWRVWSASVWQGARPITGRTDLSGRNTCSTQFQYLDKIFILIYLSCAMLSRIIFPCFWGPCLGNVPGCQSGVFAEGHGGGKRDRGHPPSWTGIFTVRNGWTWLTILNGVLYI